MRELRIVLSLVVLAGFITAPAEVRAAAADAEVTFAADVAPIFQSKCQRCHRPGTGAPMSLLTWEETRPWARSIKKRVASREMPPWHIDRTIGVYDPDPSLTDEEIATVVSWVDSGARRGDPADLPPPIDWPDSEAWEYGEPDLVVEMEEEMVVPAEGPDLFTSFVADSGLEEDRYVRWIEVKPSVEGRPTVHHVIVYAIQDDADYIGEDRVEGDDDPTRVDREGNKLGSLLIEYAVGNTGDIYRDGTAKLLMAGAKIRFSPHYHSVGTEIR
ncbi:MAG: cytochrome c, partial [Thermoanaerobaculia bacterium]|nr:cytochrome c [Thermoanaerobaculia bacterium]